MQSKEFIDYVLHRLQTGLNQKEDRVITQINPTQLEKEFPLDLGKSHSLDQVIGHLEQIMYYSVNTRSKFFCNQLYGGADLYATLGDFLTTYLNTSGATYEVSPIFTLMEREIIQHSLELFGFPIREKDTNGRITGGNGIMLPGGSSANLAAFHLARTWKNPQLNGAGLYISTPMKVFCSQAAHYSLRKSMMITGMGSHHLISIPCDAKGKMRIDLLEQAIIRHQPNPLMIVATCGTTVLGAFDAVDQIAILAKKYGIWLHVDASWGGALAFCSAEIENNLSKKKSSFNFIGEKSFQVLAKRLLKGVSKANSVVWNPHKMLKVPLQCSIFMVQDAQLLLEGFASDAEYLFQKDKPYPAQYDLGENTFQCGRRIDSLKFWLPWKIYGDAGYQKQVICNLENAQLMVCLLRDRKKFKLVIDEVEYANVCFWYLPEKTLNHGQLHELAPKIKQRLMSDGTLMINYQPMDDLPNFFRMVFHDSTLIKADLIKIIDLIEAAGDAIFQETYANSMSL